MNIIDSLKDKPFTLKDCMFYFLDKKYDVQKIITNDNHLETICYYMEYLESKGVYILTDHNGYAVYKQFEDDKQISIIQCEFIPTLIAKYVMGIINGFKYLENPF